LHFDQEQSAFPRRTTVASQQTFADVKGTGKQARSWTRFAILEATLSHINGLVLCISASSWHVIANAHPGDGFRRSDDIGRWKAILFWSMYFSGSTISICTLSTEISLAELK
jgi:hypothetical protein